MTGLTSHAGDQLILFLRRLNIHWWFVFSNLVGIRDKNIPQQ